MLFVSQWRPLPAMAAVQEQADVEAEVLIDKASYQYGLVEDYSLALRLLEKAKQTARSPRLKAIALVKTAYVYFLMGKKAKTYRPWILKALEQNPALELQNIYYKLSFIKYFKRVKKSPGAADLPAPKLRETETRTETDMDMDMERPAKRKKFFLSAALNFLMHADGNFKETYGSAKMFPRVTAGYLFGRSLFVWASFGTLSASGVIPDTTYEASSSQSYLSLGVGFRVEGSKRLYYSMCLGLMRASFKEETLGLTYSGSASGFDFYGAVMFNLSSSLFVEASAGYLSSRATVFDRNATIGGLRTGIGLGFLF
jgi:hypothetical protein